MTFLSFLFFLLLACVPLKSPSRLSKMYLSVPYPGPESRHSTFPAGGMGRPPCDGPRISLQGDAEEFDAKSCFSISGFDRVYLSYCLSMIPDWRRALDQALHQVGEDGELHIVDFGQMAWWPAFARRWFGAWLSKFCVSPRADLLTVAKNLALKHGVSVSFDEIGGGYAWLIVLKRLEDH